MKTFFLLTFIGLGSFSVFSQIENTTGNLQIESTEKNFETPEGYTLPAIKRPTFNKNEEPTKYSDLGENKSDKLDMNKDDGLLENKSGKAPKYFSNDKEITEEIGGDQYLGEVKTGAGFVNVQYRDHQYVDGDLIRVFVNDDIVQSGIYLSGSFQGFNLPLEKGFNRIDFLALNQGSSGPNTAELYVYDDTGKLISANEWNLLTGDKATVVIIKE